MVLYLGCSKEPSHWDGTFEYSQDIYWLKTFKVYIIQLLTNEALDMMWYRPENTNIDRGEVEVNIVNLWSISHHIQWGSPRSILVFSGRYHIISNASLVNNCFIIIIITFRERCTSIIAPGKKILNIYTSFGTVKHLAETVQTYIRPPVYYFIYVVHECHHSIFTNKNSNTPRL